MVSPELNVVQLICYGFVSFATAILGGIAGGGAGFINAPLLIFFGLTPAQAVASGKWNGLAAAVASLRGLRGVTVRLPKQHLVMIMLMACIVGVTAPLIIKGLNSDAYRQALGIVLLLMIPVLIIKKIHPEAGKASTVRKSVGYALLSPVLFLQAVFGAGAGILVNIVFMTLLGMSPLESSVIKRYTQLALNGLIVIGVLGAGLIVWPVVLIGLATSLTGAYIGARIAVRRGDTWVVWVLVGFTVVSAVYLIFG